MNKVVKVRTTMSARIHSIIFEQETSTGDRLSSMEKEPIVFEVEPGPSIVSLIVSTIFSVNYTDIPIILVIAFNLISLFIFYKYKNDLAISTVHFLVSCFNIYITQSVNSYLTDFWKSYYFSRNYFTADCVFVFTFWTLPNTIVAIGIIISLFLDLSKSIAVHRYFSKMMPKVPATETKGHETQKVKKD